MGRSAGFVKAARRYECRGVISYECFVWKYPDPNILNDPKYNALLKIILNDFPHLLRENVEIVLIPLESGWVKAVKIQLEAGKQPHPDYECINIPRVI